MQQKIYKIVPGEFTERNRKARQRMKKMRKLLQMLPDYVPRREWIDQIKAGQTPSRANFYNYKEMGHDLREFLIQQNSREAAKRELLENSQLQASSLTNTNQPGPSKPIACHMVLTRTITNIKAQSQHDGNAHDSEPEPPTQDLDDGSILHNIYPYFLPLRNSVKPYYRNTHVGVYLHMKFKIHVVIAITIDTTSLGFPTCVICCRR